MGRALATAPLVGARMDISRLNSAKSQRRLRPLQTQEIETMCDFLPGVVGALTLPRDRDLGRLATRAGASWGKVRGSIRTRTLYL